MNKNEIEYPDFCSKMRKNEPRTHTLNGFPALVLRHNNVVQKAIFSFER